MELFNRIKQFAGEGEKPAIVDHNGDRTTTYPRLLDMIYGVAAKLKNQGLEKGDTVIVKMGRCAEYVIAELGIMYAGCVCVPVLPEYPKDRIDYISEESGAKFVITQSFFSDIGEGNEPLDDASEDAARALIIFTSGSTGKPKGIVYTARVIDNPIRNNQSNSRMLKDIRFAAMAPMSFVATLGEYFNVLSLGGCSHVISDEVRTDIKKIEEYYAKHKLSVGFLPPRMLNVYNNSDAALQIINTGSERVSNICPQGYKVINNYGQSETCGTVCSFVIDKAYETTPIGKPKQGITIHLLDENGDEVPDGEEGEICAQGVLPCEYLNLPEQTAKTFVKLDNGEVLVHTGDIGRKLPDGNYIYVNRKDWMIKINGQRVDLGEIEGAMKLLPGVKDAAVKDFTYINGQVYLCGYFVAEKNVDEQDIRKGLAAKLPPYMIPTYYVRLDKLPTNVNGKLDKPALAAPDISSFKAKYAAPETDMEKLLCSSYESILRCGKVGLDDNFFLLGGDSIKAMQLQNLCDIPALTTDIIIKGKTPRKIAEEMQKPGVDIMGDAMREERAEYPFSPSQLGVYLECVQNPGGTMYNNPFAITFKKSEIDIEKLVEAVKKSISNHGALNMRIVSVAGNPMMRPELTPVNVERVKTLDIDKAKAAFVRPFDIANDILYRVCVFEDAESYALCMDIHHIVFDGTSLSVLLGEISKAYSGEPIPPERVSQLKLGIYSELAEKSPAYADAKKYFDDIFAGVDNKAEFVTDGQEVATDDKPCESIVYTISEELSAEKCEAVAAGLDITPNTLFLGAYMYAVSKFTCSDDVVVTTASHGRHDSRMANTVGMMVRTVPLYVHIDEESTIADYLSGVQATQRESVSNDVYPFFKLAESYGLNNDIMFAFQSDAFNSLAINGQKVPLEELSVKSALSKVGIMVFKQNGGYALSMKYRSDLYGREIIKSFLDMYINILSGFTQKEKLCEVELCNERQLGVLDSFHTESAFPSDKSVVQLFREQAAATPDAVALVYLDKKFTYKELDEISERVAYYVSSKKIGKNDVVSVLIPRCEYMTIISLGVLKAGAAYQPLDPSYPPERLNFMMSDSGAKLLIADKGLLSLVDEYKGDVLLTEDIPSLPAGKLKRSCAPKPEDLFIMLYTSGTTGKPKGVMIEHGNIVALCHQQIKMLSLNSESRVAAYASFGFDANVSDTYPTLLSGGTLYIVDDSIRFDLIALNEYYKQVKITNAMITTQLGRLFALSTDSPYLKTLMVGGEKLVPLDPPKSFNMYNGYGPTETIAFISAFKLDKLYRRVPVGKGVDNSKLYIVDKYMRRLPVGALGELCITGYQVGRGYLNRPEQKAFCVNPFSDAEHYTRMYKTGDVVRFLPDGNMDIIGRRDGQVKIRGFRIELSEVEKIIREFSGIKDATVVAKDAAGGGKQIVAYVVSDEKVDIDALNAFISANKPAYMVPAATMQIDKIPLNVNGKVDWRKLPDVVIADDQAEETSRAETVLEKRIKAVVSKILGTDKFGVSASLQKYGLTSLSVIRLAVELRKEFGYEADVKSMMKGCSILSIENDIMKYLLDVLSGQGAQKQAAKEYKETYPLSKAQFGVYAECMRDPQSTKYNVPCVYEFSAEYDAETLKAAIKAVIAAHPYVFTHLVMKNDDVEQVYTDGGEVDIPEYDFDEQQFEKFKNNFVQPFNFMNSPLFRIAIVRSAGKIYLFCDFHHIVFDGGSADLFMKQLKSTLEGAAPQKEKYNYFDYVDKEEEDFRSDKFAAAEKYFSDMLSDCESASEISPDVSGKQEEGSLAIASVPTDLAAAEKYCKQNGVTPAHLYLAATFYAVSRFTNSRNVYLSTISNGRSDLKLSDCFGMFVKTIPVGIGINDVTSREFISATANVFAGAIDNELYPYSTVCRKFGYAPNIMYEYQLGVTEKLVINGKEINIKGLAMNNAKFKIAVHIEYNDGVPSVVVQYNDAMYSAGFMRTLALSIETAMRNMISTPDGKVRKVSMLPSEDKKIIDGFSCTQEGEVEIKLLHKMFEAQVDKSPSAIAISAIDGKYTYAQLDERANAVANALIERGFKPQDKAVVLLERTSDIFAAELGIMKAGGVFIPSVVDYPEERINAIAEDSEAKIIICSGGTLSKYKNTVDIEELISSGKTNRPDVKVDPDDLAYMIYTSGSTGKPKGVMLRHIGICNYLSDKEANVQVHKVVQKCRNYGSVTTVAFDMSLKETFLSLVNGLTLVFADDEMMLDPFKLAAFFKANNVDVFNATPSRLLQYMEIDEFAKVMAGCKVILSGGEGYPQALLDLLRKKTHAEIMNTYGPTEITVSSNCAVLTKAEVISVGKPLYNYHEYIVDCDDNILPIGVVGELIIAGCGVARGYNKLPEKTAEAFIEFAGRRAYRSGDYAKWTPGGDVVILGRKDNQVKIRGLRIELGEIEKCFTEIASVKRAVIVIRKIGKEDAICAYFTADKPLDAAELKEELGKKLTDYMIPASFNQLDAMPLTPNGKVNIKALPEPFVQARAAGILPSTPLEKQICDIYAKVLERDNVYADDSFFEIGGTSLTVTRVIIAAGKANLNVAYGDVFAHPTPASLAAFIAAGETTVTPDSENFANYDYTGINKTLAENNIASFKAGEIKPIGNILLTGATGFLGIHILSEFLHKYPGKVYCLARGRKSQSAEARLSGTFFYYFEETPLTEYADRLQVIEGDVTDKEVFKKLELYDIDTVINCAAVVKHFSKGTEIEDVNYYGTLNTMNFCKNKGCRLIHVSTMSVGGAFVGQRGDVDDLEETQLFFGQTLDSKYTRSKFMAERAILDEVANGLNAKIMRVGTLAPRNSDGEYQINFATNNFMRRLKSVYVIGKYPYEMIEMPFELSPIDSVASAILMLAQTPDKCTVFHPYNNNTLFMGNLYAEMNRLGLKCEAVEMPEYMKALDEAKQDPEKADVLAGFIAYENSAHGQKVFAIGKSNLYTMQVLYRMGFRWPVTSTEYMRRFISALRTLGFFD